MRLSLILSSPKFRVLINIFQILFVILMACTMSLLISYLFLLKDNDEFIVGLATILCVPAIFLFYLKVKKIDWKDFSPFQGENFIRILCIVLAGAGINLIFSSLFMLMPQSIINDYGQFSDALLLSNPLITIPSIFIISPIVEEFFFRGVLIYELQKGFSSRHVIFIQAMLFSLSHANWVQIIFTFILGCILGFLTIKYKNLLFSISLHLGYNLFGFLIFLLSLQK